MLCLERKKEEAIVIGEGSKRIIVRIGKIRGDRVDLVIEAPREIPVYREEIYLASLDKNGYIDHEAVAAFIAAKKIARNALACEKRAAKAELQRVERPGRNLPPEMQNPNSSHAEAFRASKRLKPRPTSYASPERRSPADG